MPYEPNNDTAYPSQGWPEQKYHIEIRVCPVIEDGIDTSLAHRSILSQGEGWDQQQVIALSNTLAGYLDFATGTNSVKSLWTEEPFTK